ncbi:MAG: TraR/DksA C4-type zinc finger protein [Planctomycetes bacterium]|nr:TraR/DksA C4-type zinc finger protein [Planctomycetota bacterium]
MARQDALLRLHKSLLARRDHLRKKLAEELAQMSSTGTGDSADVAFESGSDEMTSQLAEFDARELTQIERALSRLKQGTYGICEGCQKKIPVGRLNALPYATHCVECQREMERYPDWADRRGGGNWEHVLDPSSLYEDKEVKLSDLETDLSHNR